MLISTDSVSVKKENNRKYTDSWLRISVFFFVFAFYTDYLSVYFKGNAIPTDHLSVFFYDFAKSTDSRYSESVFFSVVLISTDFVSVEKENNRKYTDSWLRISVFFFVFAFYTDHLSVYFKGNAIPTDYLSVFFYDFANSTDSRHSESVFFLGISSYTDLLLTASRHPNSWHRKKTIRTRPRFGLRHGKQAKVPFHGETWYYTKDITDASEAARVGNKQKEKKIRSKSHVYRSCKNTH